MRKWISLVEEMSQTELSDLYMDIASYVTAGEWTSPTQFNKLLQSIYDRVPRPEHSMILYRVIRLDEAQQEQYKNGTLVLEPREFASWTKSIESARILAQKKGDNTIILKKEFEPDHIVLDVVEFYDENEYHGAGMSEYDWYVRPEQEVVVYHQEAIQVTADNSMVISVADHPHPMQGDRVFSHEDDEDGIEIEDVDYEQEFANRGLYSVSTNFYGDIYVRWIGELNGENQWEIVDDVYRG
jgi:hypothetical protein